MLSAHRPEIEHFVSALFRYADEGTVVGLRSFTHDKDDRRPRIQGWPAVRADLSEIVDAATRAATSAANEPTPLVFCPPLCTFNQQRAREIDLANGVTISVEIDQGNTHSAKARLEGLLGPATVVVASGGEWVDPETGELHPKLHLHWRLSEPTRTSDEHAKLKQARDLAMVLVGADPSAVPAVHPLRWPGSWHRKGSPKLAMGVGGDENAEVHLVEALDILEGAVEQAGLRDFASDHGPHEPGEPQAAIARLRPAMMAIPNTDATHWDEWVKWGLTIHRATGGSEDGRDLWTEWSAKSPKFVAEECDERWAHFHTHAFGKRGAGSIFFVARAHGWQPPATERPQDPTNDGTIPPQEGQSAFRSGSKGAKPGEVVWGKPLDFFTDQNREPPVLTADHVPTVIFDFAFDVAERMGVDPVSVVMCELVALATAITDDWRVQPKRFDYTWTEQPRLWAAIVGPPSILKSPVLAACTKPLEVIEEKARKRHSEAMRQFKRRLKEFKDEVKQNPDAVEPVMPKRERYMVEGTTTEALSEVLRDDDEAMFDAPARKVLVRQDELSEFFGNLDRYKAGGKGGGDRGAYLRLFNGGRYTVDRVQRGSFVIPNWSANFLGGIQPGPMQRLARGTDDDGMLQRFLYVVPAAQGYGVDRAPLPGISKRYADLFSALVALTPPNTPDGEHIQTVAIHEDGHQDREDVNQVAKGMALLHSTLPRLQAAFGKWPGLFARLCLIFHLIEIADIRASQPLVKAPTTLVVPARITAMVARFMCEIVLPHLLRADAIMFRTAQTSHIEKIAGWILIHKLKQITVRDLMRNYRPLGAAEDKPELMSVMAALSVTNWLEPQTPDNPAKSVNSWLVNPAVHEQFGHYAEREAARREQFRTEIEAAKSIKAGRRADASEQAEGEE